MTTRMVPSTNQLDAGLLLARLATGGVLAAHGAQKVFVYSLGGVAAAFGEMGIPMAQVVGPAVALVELLGGIALALGFLTRLSAIGLATVMLGASILVHRSAFFLPNGAEFTLLLGALAGMFILTGPGRHSVDARLARS